MITIGIDASRANVAKRTGTEWYCYYLLKQLQQIIPAGQYQVVLYVKEPLLPDLAELPSNWSVQVLRWPPRLLWTQLRLSLTMLWPGRRPDILFIPAHTIPLIHPRHTIYVAHDLGFERITELYGKHYIGGKVMNVLVRILTLGKYGTSELDYHRWSMRFAARHAQTIIAISEFTKQELLARYTIHQRTHIQVIHHGLSRTTYSPLQLPPPLIPYLLYVGRIEHKKNIVNLIKAFALLKQQTHCPHQLWLVGSAGYGYEDIKDTIKDLGIADSVIEPGYIPQDQMNRVMNQATAFVFPTRYEGFGMPILEALATHQIVCCSDLPVLHEVGGQACWYFNPLDPADIAKTLTKAVQSSSTARQAQAEIAEQQVKQFSWERCAAETWQAIRNTLD